MPEDAGVCWLDVPNFLTESCVACKDGEVCVHRSPTELFCVPFDVCDALYKLGATTACRYADKTPFTDTPLLTEPFCPPGMTNILCGGGCGTCSGLNKSWECVGRSATRPFGVCILDWIGNPPIPCSYDASGHAIASCVSAAGLKCAIFDNPAPDDVAALRFGACMPMNDCIAASKSTPLKCLDEAGVNFGS